MVDVRGLLCPMPLVKVRKEIEKNNPATLEYQNRPNRWAGNLCLPKAVQHENVLFCIYRILPDFVDYLNSHLYFPKHEMDEVVEEKGYIFGRKGKGYIAVSVISAGDQYWEEKDKALFAHVYGEKAEEMYQKAEDYEYVAQGHAAVWAVEMGSEAENGSFRAFIDGFKEKGLAGDTHAFTYFSPTFGEMRCGWGKELVVEGKTINIHQYPRYDMPGCEMAFDADEINICGDKHTLSMRFDKLIHTEG